MLEELKQFKFFLNVGKSGNVTSWHDAISSLRSEGWYKLLERSRVAILSVPVNANDETYTPKVRFFRKELIEVISKIELPSEKKGDRDVFDYVREELLAQTLGLLTEVETSHGHNDTFMRDVWTITKKGCFVCGYEGDYPNGTFKFF